MQHRDIWEGLRVRERIEDRRQITWQITCGSAWLAVKSAHFSQLTGQQKIIREDRYVIGLVNYLHVNAQGDTCWIAARRDESIWPRELPCQITVIWHPAHWSVSLQQRPCKQGNYIEHSWQSHGSQTRPFEGENIDGSLEVNAEEGDSINSVTVQVGLLAWF